MIDFKQAGKASGTFYFKQFKVEDGRSTMKVGTDAVLLGAAADLHSVTRILEIGTGSAVITLMLAQRSNALIDAVDIDADSAEQAKTNVLNSPWRDRIKILHASLQDYAKNNEEKYDLVVSNPPFFTRSLKSPSDRRNLSRHNDSLSFGELISGSLRLMLPDASLWIILPVKEANEFINEAASQGLFPLKIIKIYSKPSGCQQRNIIHLKRKSTEKLKEEIIAIRTDDGIYSREYIDLTREFYLDF
jgi:tRNA1Val (adenine37-N6)-methyltransferase